MSDEEKQERCSFCGSTDIYQGTILTEGPGKVVDFTQCSGCGRSYRENFLGDGKPFTLMDYKSHCPNCKKTNKSFRIDTKHPTAVRIRNTFFNFEEMINHCHICNTTSRHKIISLQFTIGKEIT